MAERLIHANYQHRIALEFFISLLLKIFVLRARLLAK